jgi:hypothetical protein
MKTAAEKAEMRALIDQLKAEIVACVEQNKPHDEYAELARQLIDMTVDLIVTLDLVDHAARLSREFLAIVVRERPDLEYLLGKSEQQLAQNGFYERKED